MFNCVLLNIYKKLLLNLTEYNLLLNILLGPKKVKKKKQRKLGKFISESFFFFNLSIYSTRSHECAYK